MLGSSRVGDGLRSSDVGRQLGRDLGRDVLVFNFGVPGCGPVKSLLFFERLRAEGVKPDLLLIEVVPKLLTSLPADCWPSAPVELQSFRGDQCWPHEWALVERYGFPADPYGKDHWQYWLAPCYRQRFAILGGVFPMLLQSGMNLQIERAWKIDDSGWTYREEVISTPDFKRQAVAVARRDHGEVLARFEFCQAACRAQRDLLARCREEQIPAALVLMPESTEFRSWYGPMTVAQLERHLGNLSHEFSVPVVDARGWVGDEGFVDGHHLQPNGATVFSERFGRDVVEPVIALDPRERAEYLASWSRGDRDRTKTGGAADRRRVGQAAVDSARRLR
jgi:hypothetical protein